MMAQGDQLRRTDYLSVLVGRRYGYYPVAAIQVIVCFVTVIACIILGGQGMKVNLQTFVFSILFISDMDMKALLWTRYHYTVGN